MALATGTYGSAAGRAGERPVHPTEWKLRNDQRSHGGRVRLTALSLALTACISSGAHAQSNTTGTISGQAGSGDTITAISDDTGFQRSITAGADGTFRFSSLPAGRYRITRTGPDGTATTREVLVNTGTGSSVSFAEAGPSTLDAVQVRGMAAVNPIDLSSVESTTIFTEAQLDALPVARDITDVALLAPGTVKGDPRFGNVASFGGSSAAENLYYINGFNVTNIVTGLAFNQVPFEAIAESAGEGQAVLLRPVPGPGHR